VGRHQLHYERLEISENFDLRQRFFFYWIHSVPQTGMTPDYRDEEVMQTLRRTLARQGSGGSIL
jgi:hypothetical protein